MTDIVERLRYNAPADHGLASGDLMREAATEIERLRAIPRDIQVADSMIRDLRAQVEQLRAELGTALRDTVRCNTEVARLYEAMIAERDELRAEVERLRAWAEDERLKRHQAEEDRMNARSEVEHLRAALKAIERRTAPSTRTWDTCLGDMGLANDLARAALEPKP